MSSKLPARQDLAALLGSWRLEGLRPDDAALEGLYAYVSGEQSASDVVECILGRAGAFAGGVAAKTDAAGPDPYVDAATGVLKNKLGIVNAADLEQAECNLSLIRALVFGRQPVLCFDLAYLQAIHRQLFGDLYVWAGQIRSVDIAKGQSRFAHFAYVEAYLDKVLQPLAQGRLPPREPAAFAEQAAYYLGEINAAHPFREGNGRTMREFVGRLAGQCGYRIAWENVGRDAMTDASVRSFRGDNGLLVQIIRDNLNVL
ncbi:MAG: Fic family protein [Neisseria sp.]|nr:Fic family protein [Neisseria sp.]